MESLQFIASFGNEQKPVSLSQPNGANGTIHLNINHYYYGQFVKYNGKWEPRLQDEKSIHPEDLAIITDMVNEHFSQ